MDLAGPTARRFPLVPRPRPACLPLADRVGDLCALADTAQRTHDQTTASAVFNQAALLASDVGLPDLARTWCHRHAELRLRDRRPLSAQAARHALEPVVNLARLHIRAGAGDTAGRFLDSLYQAVSARTDIHLDGIAIPAATLTATADDHRTLRQWLWTVMLADGVRARTSVGRWDTAAAFVRRHQGIGRRMFDGRQVTIIASAAAGDLTGCRTLLDETHCDEPWEEVVTACLTVLCRPPGHRLDASAAARILDLYRQLESRSTPAAFRIRLALAAVDLTEQVDVPGARQLALYMINDVFDSGDGHAARDLLLTPAAGAYLSAADIRELTALVNRCGLGSGALAAPLLTDVLAALDRSAVVLAHTPTTSPQGTSTDHEDNERFAPRGARAVTG
ncbi:hypothetical protein AB1484_33140 [Parafrankia sp. FMc6]|uniref:hypothetical protein n=1 Tax=Parafrankia soli TaxID=2599596 RepID=UPI0034D61116